MYFKFGKRKVFLQIVFSFSLLFVVSCSNPNNIVLKDDSVNLKSIAVSYEEKIKWAEEIEKNRLKQKIPAVDGIDKTIKITPINILFSLNEETVDPVYPELSGIGKINTSALSSEQFELLDKFCSAVIEDASVEQYVSKQSFYTLVLFLYDINEYSMKFASYIAGEPFFADEENIECPVRFFYENNKPDEKESFFDVNIFLTKESEKWSVSQIVYDIE